MSPFRAHRLLPGLAIGALALWGCSASEVRYEPVRVAPAAPTTLEAAVYLLGDAGEDSPGRQAVLAHARADMQRLSRDNPGLPILVAYLGDNIYEVGARRDFKEEDLAHLTAQVGMLAQVPGAQAVFLPGNHDWAKGAGDEAARESIRVQQEWLGEVAGNDRAQFLPVDGCPGPASLDIGRDVHVVFIDTEWLLRRPEDDCGGIDGFYQRLRGDLATNLGKRVVLAAHHPMATGGPHGGNIGLFHRGPVVYYLAVKSGLSVQDLASGRYSDMLAGIRSAIYESGSVPLVFAAGHDHSLQVIRTTEPGDPAFQLISGSASRLTPAGRTEGTRYAATRYGYMRIDFDASATRVVVFAQAEEGSPVRPVFNCTLSTAGAPAECPEAVLANGGS